MDFVQGWVTGIDVDAQTVRIDDEFTLRYDTLVYALGSIADTGEQRRVLRGVQGVRELVHARDDLGRDRQTWSRTGVQATAGRTPLRTEDRSGHTTDQA